MRRRLRLPARLQAVSDSDSDSESDEDEKPALKMAKVESGGGRLDDGGFQFNNRRWPLLRWSLLRRSWPLWPLLRYPMQPF